MFVDVSFEKTVIINTLKNSHHIYVQKYKDTPNAVVTKHFCLIFAMRDDSKYLITYYPN